MTGDRIQLTGYRIQLKGLPTVSCHLYPDCEHLLTRGLLTPALHHSRPLTHNSPVDRLVHVKLNPRAFLLGRVFGIPIRAHYSWIPVVPFYTWVLANGMLPRGVPGLSWYQYWLLGAITTLLLFASVLVHELAHALMAKAEGIGTGGITLHLFGGLASLQGQPAYPSSEFKIAIVGPASSFVLGLVFFTMYQLADSLGSRALAVAFSHLGLINWVLAAFNILPGLPLDGGRVLRAVIWRRNKNFSEATRIALKAGMIISFSLILWGAIYCIIFSNWFVGLSCISIGVIVAIMLQSSEGVRIGRSQQSGRGTVAQAMNRDVVMVPPDMSIGEFVGKVLNDNHHASFAVAEGRRLHGLLLLADLKKVEREEWSRLKVSDCMRPVDHSMFLSSGMSLAVAKGLVEKSEFEFAVVLDGNGFIVGSISSSDFTSAGK